jgi:lysophospholipase L1-like esterase
MVRDPRRQSLPRRRVFLGATAIAATTFAAACGSNRTATDTPKSTPVTPIAPTTAIPAPTTPTSAATAIASVTTTSPAPTAAATPAGTPTAAARSSLPVPETFVPPTGTPTTPLIVFVGASMVYGLGVQRTETFPAQTIAMLAPATYDAVNLGVMTGITLAELLPLAPKTIDPLYAASRSRNILVLGGTNDLGAGASVDEAFARMVIFCQARRRIGFKVVALTILPNSVPLSGGRTYENERQHYNANIRTELASYADALADVSADPTIGAAGAQLNREYYQSDGTHPTARAYAIVARIVKAAILTL